MRDWWKGAVVYQIYPRSFQDDDGDGIGDLKGIVRRLPHVASLGVDAIWLSPFFKSPMDDMGYDVSDYRDVDPRFGTLEDFDNLIATARELGLKVVIDQVLSHSSSEHPWFKASRESRTGPHADWYVWVDGDADGPPPNNWISVFGGSAWTWEPRRGQYYLHNFLDTQPDLNFHNPEVQDAMLDAMKFWLERGVDGFRLDTANFYFHDAQLRDNPPEPKKGDALPPAGPGGIRDYVFVKNRPENLDFLQRMRSLTDSYDARAMVGEIGDHQQAIDIMAAYTAGESRLHMAYSFDMLDPNYTARHFRDIISGFFERAPDGWPYWSFSNHDVIRHVSRWAKSGKSLVALAKQAIALLASFEGTIGIYQGEELGQTETNLLREELTDPVGIRGWPNNKGRDGCRTPMVWDGGAPNAGFSEGRPWLPVKQLQASRNVAGQEAAKDSVLHHYREMLSFRKATPALVNGRTDFLDLPEPVLAFVRDGEKPITCAFNLSPKPVALKISDSATLTGPVMAATLEGTPLTLGPNGYAFLDGKADIASKD